MVEAAFVTHFPVPPIYPCLPFTPGYLISCVFQETSIDQLGDDGSSGQHKATDGVQEEEEIVTCPVRSNYKPNQFNVLLFLSGTARLQTQYLEVPRVLSAGCPALQCGSVAGVLVPSHVGQTDLLCLSLAYCHIRPYQG